MERCCKGIPKRVAAAHGICIYGAPNDKEWLAALAAGACYVDTRHLDARHLFSLLNHAWRVWNKE